MRKYTHDLRGKTFGSWKVIGAEPIFINYKAKWLCRCKCGNEKEVFAVNLIRNLSTQCIKCSGIQKRKPGTSEPVYFVYHQMRARCNNSSHPYFSYYGGRGIKVCPAWENSYEQFLEDMGTRPYKTSLDRINNDKGYEPSNCRWVTKKEQQNNRRNTIHVGEISCGWEVQEQIKTKVYEIKCTKCGEIKNVRSCNYRKTRECTCGSTTSPKSI